MGIDFSALSEKYALISIFSIRTLNDALLLELIWESATYDHLLDALPAELSFWTDHRHVLRRFSCKGYRTWPCLSCRVGYRCSLYCCLHVTFHLTIPASLLLPLPFAICIDAICFLFARRFASLLLTFSRFSLILFLTVVLATATFFLLSFRTWNNFSYWILLSQLAGKNYFGTYYAYLLFFVLRMFAIDLGTFVKDNFSIP